MSENPIALIVAQCGGTASWQELRDRFSAHAIRRAVEEGVLERLSRDRYALPGLAAGHRAADRVHGFLSHRSAALEHGWSVWTAPKKPEVIVPRNHAPVHRRDASIRYRRLQPGDTADRVTTDIRTVVDCARDLPLIESLAVADSALRSGALTREDLDTADLPRTGRAAAAEVLTLASPLAANPFESAVRALTVEAVGPIFVPQVPIQVGRQEVCPDLVCEQLRIVIEGDSFGYHSSRAQIRVDCWRYNVLTLADWLVLRFAWDHPMYTPDWVRDIVKQAVARQSAQIS